MGTVYRAFDHQLERFVAVKVFEAGEASDDARRRAEATALARVSHPNLVTLLDAHLSAEGDPTPSFLVLELVDGEDLRSRLDRGPVAAVEAAAIAGGIAEALVVVHGAGMVHRDLKPANILLADSGVPGGLPHAKLADFGIAHLLGTERLTTAGMIIGTAGYLSPEQVNVSEPGPPADIYALGLVTLEALTGVTEYPGSPLEAVTARLARDPRIPASLPEDWRGLLGAMTARDPLIRPTALEVAVMARELAPQLAGWTLPAQDAPGELAPTVAMPAAELGAGALGGTHKVWPRRPVTGVEPGPRRRRIVVGAIAGGSVLAVALALTLGSTLAPAFTEPTPAGTGGSTPRPSPTVTSPAESVAPVVSQTTAPVQTTAPASEQPAAPEPAQPAAPAPAQHGPPAHEQPNPAPKPAPKPGPGKGHGPGKGGG